MNVLYAVGAFTGLIGVLIWLAKNVGSQSAKLDAMQAALKRAAKEQARANKIMDKCRNMDIADVHKRLHNITDK